MNHVFTSLAIDEYETKEAAYRRADYLRSLGHDEVIVNQGFRFWRVLWDAVTE